MRFLLDTCVLSELVSRRPSPSVVEWVDSVDPDSVYLSVITVGEIRRGIELARDEERKRRLDAWLTTELLFRFRDNLVPFDTGVLLTWGALTGRLERNGTPMPAIDSLIAATVLHHDLTLATRNVADFKNSGATLFNPWEW